MQRNVSFKNDQLHQLDASVSDASSSESGASTITNAINSDGDRCRDHALSGCY